MNKQYKDNAIKIIESAAYGSVGSLGGIAVNKLVKNKATHVVNLIAGLGMQIFSKNEVVQKIGAGLTSVGTVGTISLVVPELNSLSGIGCYQGVGCGCQGKANGLGCPDCGGTCGEKKKANGLGILTIQGRKKKLNVTRADLLTLPYATNQLIDLLPNTPNVLGFDFNFSFQQWGTPYYSLWDVIYNFYPKFFATVATNMDGTINKSIPNYAKLGLQKSQLVGNGSNRVSALPRTCALIEITYKDNSIGLLQYDKTNPLWTQNSLCTNAREGCITATGSPTDMPNGKHSIKGTTVNDKGQYEAPVGQTLTFTLDYFVPTKNEYLFEGSDGSMFFITEKTFDFILNDTEPFDYIIHSWSKGLGQTSTEKGKTCLANALGFILPNPASQPKAPEPQPPSTPTPPLLPFYIEGKTSVETMTMETFCVVNPNFNEKTGWLGLAESNVTWKWSDGVEATTPNNDPKILCTKRLFPFPGEYEVEACFYTEQNVAGVKDGQVCLTFKVNVVPEPQTPTVTPPPKEEPPTVTPPPKEEPPTVTPPPFIEPIIINEPPPIVTVPTEDGCIYPTATPPGYNRICCKTIPPDMPGEKVTIVTPPPGNQQEVIVTPPPTTQPPTSPPPIDWTNYEVIERKPPSVCMYP